MKKTQKIFYIITDIIELIVAGIIIAALFIILVRLLGQTLDFVSTDIGEGTFSNLLVVALEIVICVEFIELLVRHSVHTVIEVLIFSTARHMLVVSLTPTESLVSIFGLAILFAIRKFLITREDYISEVTLKENRINILGSRKKRTLEGQKNIPTDDHEED